MLPSDDSAAAAATHTHKSDFPVAITGAADHQLLQSPKWPLASMMHGALVWSLWHWQWHAMEWTTGTASANAIGAMDLQCLGLGGSSHIDGIE